MLVRLGQPREQVPPVVDEGDDAGGETAAREVLRGEAAPAPLVLQLVERVLAVGAVAIELAEADDLGIERGHQGGVLVRLARLQRRRKRQQRPVGIGEAHRLAVAFDPSAHQHDPARPRPARQLQRGLDALPALPGVGPVAAVGEALDGALDVLGQPQPHQIGQALGLASRHQRIGGKTLVGAQHFRPAVAADALEQRPQPRRRMIGRMLIAGHRVDIRNQAQIGQDE